MQHTVQQLRTDHYFRRGFTLVELLIVIVVIGVLAAITIIAYTGIQQRARVAVLQGDLKNASTQLATDNANNSTYPVTEPSANIGQGLKASPGTTWQYAYTSSSNSYCLTGTNSGVSYFVSSDSLTPKAGACPGNINGGSINNGGVVTTLAGSSTAGFADGTGSAAQFDAPKAVAVDSSGTVYVADWGNVRIRKITPAGAVTTLAGSSTAGFADGTGSAAQFNSLYGITVDTAGTVYVADGYNHRIRKITPAGVVTTLAGSSTPGFADGTGGAAQFNAPFGVSVDASGTVYVADTSNHRIRKITPAGVVTTLAGFGTLGFADGTGSAAQFNSPFGVSVDASGTVYVADTNNNRIRKITPAGVVTTLAGSGTPGFADGTGSAAQFYAPNGITVDTAGTVYVADSYNHSIRKITPAGVVTTLTGSAIPGFADGTGSAAQFRYPRGITVDTAGTVYVADSSNYRIRKIQ